jgi:hypothetical protein
MKTRLLIFSLLFIGFISCDSKDIVVETDLSTLEKQQQLWESKGIDSYSFTQRISCFCPYEYTQPKEVVVWDGVIVSVAGVAYDAELQQSILTVAARFDYIRKSLAREPEMFSVEYDAVYGFPSRFYFDFSFMIADEEVDYTFTDFTSQK